LYCNQFLNQTAPILLQDDTDNSILGMLGDQGNCNVISPQTADNVFINSVYPDITSFIADGFDYYHRNVPQLTPSIMDLGGGTTAPILCIDAGLFISCATWQEIPDGMVGGLGDERQKDYVLLKKFWNYFLEEQDTTTAMGLLNSVETALATRLKIAIAMGQDNYTTANMLKNTLLNVGEESLRYKQLLDLEIDLAQDTRTYLQLTSEEEDLVRQIAATNTLAAMDARIILYSAYGEEIVFALPQLPPIIADSLGNWSIHFKNQVSNVSSVTVYPNPANEYLNFQLNLMDADPSSLKIYNSIGIQVYEAIINDNDEIMPVNTANWVNGLYYYRLTDSQNTFYTGKFVVSGK